MFACSFMFWKMVLLKYFKRIEPSKEKKIQSVLPKPDGSLAPLMPSSTIQAANSAVREILTNNPIDEDSPIPCSKTTLKTVRGTYQIFTDKEKVELARRAAEQGITSTIRYFTKIEGTKGKDQRRTISPSTLHGWKIKYLQELAKRRPRDETPEVIKLPGKKRGRPLLLGEEMDTQVEVFLKQLRENGAVVNTAIVMATAEGIVRNHDSSLLASNGGSVVITKNWAKSLMTRMNFVKRWANTKIKVFSIDFEEHKSQFVYDVKSIIEFEDIPEDLVIN